METLRSHYVAELNALQRDVVHMGRFVASMLHDAICALIDRDPVLAREVRKRDALADQYDDQIERAAIRLIALEQPLAGDLRVVASALKLVTDLERLGDYACDIAKSAIALADVPICAPLEDITRMAEIVEGMIRDALDTFVTRDVAFGKKVRDRDREVDALYKRVFAQLMDWMAGDPKLVRPAAELLLVARYLERLGDHTKNIIERVAYMETGSRWPWRSEEWKQARARQTAQIPSVFGEQVVDPEE